MKKLTTRPTFLYKQGEMGDKYYESPVQIIYGTQDVELVQDDKSIYIGIEHLPKLFRKIKEHLPEALKHLK